MCTDYGGLAVKGDPEMCKHTCAALTEGNVRPVAQVYNELMNPSNLLSELSAKLGGDGT